VARVCCVAVPFLRSAVCPQVALCGEFKMTGYPSIFLGRPDAFTAHNGDNVTEYPHEHKRAPADIVSWVAQQLSAYAVLQSGRLSHPQAYHRVRVQGLQV
jgi:hypothetical protein